MDKEREGDRGGIEETVREGERKRDREERAIWGREWEIGGLK